MKHFNFAVELKQNCMKKLFTLSILLSVLFLVNAQKHWTELSYFDGLNKSCGKVLSYNGTLYTFYFKTGKVVMGVSTDNGQSFTEQDLPEGSGMNWYITNKGYMYSLVSDAANVWFYKIAIANLNASTIEFDVVERGTYDPDSTMANFMPSSVHDGPNGEIWINSIHSEDNGASWTNTGGNFNPSIIAPNGDVMLYQSNGYVSQSDDEGATFSQIYSDGPWKNINGVHYIGDATLDTIFIFSSDYPVMSVDNGSTWDTINDSIGIGNYKGYIASNHEMYMWTDYGTIYNMELGGEYWEDVYDDFSFKTTAGMTDINGLVFAAIGGKLYTAGEASTDTTTNDTTTTDTTNNNSIAELYNNKVHVYPNPMNAFITIESSLEEAKTVEIINVFGQVAVRQALLARIEKISTGFLAKGSYVVRVLNDNNEVISIDRIAK